MNKFFLCNVSLKKIIFFIVKMMQLVGGGSVTSRSFSVYFLYLFGTNYAGTIYSTVYRSSLIVEIVTVNSSYSELSTDELAVFFFFLL